jgi:WD repeat-containing protein 61
MYIKDKGNSVTISKDKSEIAIGSKNEIIICDYINGKIKYKIRCKKQYSEFKCVRYSPNGKNMYAVINSANNFPAYVAIWNVNKYSKCIILKCHDTAINTINFMPNKNILISCGLDKKIKIWDIDKIKWDNIKNEYDNIIETITTNKIKDK